MYLLKYKDSPNFTGQLFGLNFINSLALCKYQLTMRALTHRRDMLFEDVTPASLRRRESPYKRVMISRWGAFGDMLIVTPVFRGLKEKYPGIEIHVSAQQLVRPLLENNPYVDMILKALPQDLSITQDWYDQVWDLTHSIELNPEAEARNAYDIVCEWLDVNPSSMLPEVYLTQNEIDEANEQLIKHGIIGDFIAVHPRASASMRDYPILKMITVLDGLAKMLPVVVLGVQAFPVFNEKIIDLTGKTNIRGAAAITSLAKLVVAGDSFGSHLAGAFRRPLIHLSGPFDPATRYTHFEQFYCLKSDLFCTNCHVHDNACRHSGLTSACLSAIPEQDIVDLAERVLNGTAEVYSFPDKLRMTEYHEDKRVCPICQTWQKAELIARKGSFLHFRCGKCHAIYTDRFPLLSQEIYNTNTGEFDYHKVFRTDQLRHYNKTVADVHLSSIENSIGGPGTLLEIGCSIGSFLKAAKDRGWDVTGVDVGEKAIGEARELLPDVPIHLGDYWDIPELKDKKFDVIALIHTIEHFEDPLQELETIQDMFMHDNSILLIIAPDADQCPHNASDWGHLKTFYPGEHSCILGENSLFTITKRLGLRPLFYHKDERNEEFTLIAGNTGFDLKAAKRRILQSGKQRKDIRSAQESGRQDNREGTEATSDEHTDMAQ